MVQKNWRLFLLINLTILLVISSLVISCLPEESGERSEILNLWDSGPMTLDPAMSSELSSHNYIMQIFSGLVYLDDDLKPAPDIAKSWQIGEDGKTYTFFLRKGVKFHNGKEVTAQDFKYSWERTCNPKTESQTAAMYLGDILGVTDVLEDRATNIKGIEIIDDYTIKITIETPKSYFLAKLAYPTAFVVDQNNVESKEGWWHEPNGTGPFKLKKWETDKILILESNQNHYRQPPRINQIAFHLLAGMPMMLYEMGQIDVAPVFEDYMDRVKDEKGPFYKELAVFPELSLFYIGFNTKKPPFDDVNIRQAFCHAVNKERIIQLTLKGTAAKADGIIPPGMPGYNENVHGLDYDVAKAKELIASSKYGSIENLPPITITISGWGGNISDNLGAVIQEWQHNLGIEVTVRQLDPQIFHNVSHLRQEVDEMFMLGWIADYPDPQNFLENLFNTDAVFNIGNYSNSTADEMIKKASSEADEAARLSMYQNAEQIMLNEASCLPLWFSTNYMLVKPYVKNFKLNAMGIPNLNQIYIEK